ncbi:YybH family protein [Pseudomonas lactis]|nr:nuclear transport factor 2 family protein [Pseudomonas lactis]
MMTIKSVLGLYETALNTNDIDAILGLYSTEPVFMPQHSTALVGRDAVRAGYKQVFATLKLNVQFTIHEIEEVGNWAWVRTSSAGTTRVLDSGVDVNEGNNELFVFRNEVGRWKIYRYLFATTQPRI